MALLVVRTGPGGCRTLGLFLFEWGRCCQDDESHDLRMKCLLSLVSVFGVAAITAIPAIAEQKAPTTTALSPFWMGASQASAGVICYAYLNDMITKDEAVRLISNDYRSVFEMEIESQEVDMDTRFDFSQSYVAWFRDTLERAGCESLKDPYGIGKSE